MKRYGLAGIAAAAFALLVYGPRPAMLPSPQGRCDRIVSLVPSATEMLFAVGAGDQVVGVTTYCDYPEAARSKEKIGDLVVNFERVVALRPDVVVSMESMAREATLALERMGMRVVRVDAESLEEVAVQLERLGAVTGHAEEGARAAERLRTRVRRVEEDVRGRPAPTVFFEATPDPLWTAGPASYAGDAIRRAGGRNIMDDLPRPWASVPWEVVVGRDPDVILVAHEHRSLLERRPGWSGLKAVKSGRVYFVPKDAFYYPTPRLADGLELAARLLHEAR